MGEKPWKLLSLVSWSLRKCLNQSLIKIHGILTFPFKWQNDIIRNISLPGMWHLLKETIGIKIKQTHCLPPFRPGCNPATSAPIYSTRMRQCPLAMVDQAFLFAKILIISRLIRCSRLLTGKHIYKFIYLPLCEVERGKNWK